GRRVQLRSGAPAWARAVVPATGAVHVGAVVAGDGPDPWLLAGSTTVPGRAQRVAFYSSPRPGAPWVPAPAAAVGPDGPEATIRGLARAGGRAVAFGWYNSPNHGIPRPSPWVAGPGTADWREVPTVRELFSGENVVTLGDVAGGARGFTIAGTWVNASGRSVATVWRSSDGQQWRRIDSDPVLAGARGEITSALGAADGPAGVAGVGDALVPTPADPGGERGALWQSGDGSDWARVAPTDAALGAPGAQVRVDHVAATPTGWCAVGSWSTSATRGVVVWSWGPGRRLAATTLGGGERITSTAVAASGATDVVSAVVDSKLRVWASSGGNAFHPVAAPAAAPGGPPATVLAALNGHQLLLAVDGPNGSQVWWGSV